MPPDLAAFAADLTAEFAGQGAHDSLLVADAVSAAVRLKILFSDPRLYLPHAQDRSWDRDHDLAARAYLRAYRALRAHRSAPPTRPHGLRPAPPSPPPAIEMPPPPGPEAPPTPEHPTPTPEPAPRVSPTPSPLSRESFDSFLRPALRNPHRPIRNRPRSSDRARPQSPAPDRLVLVRRPVEILPVTASPRASPPS